MRSRRILAVLASISVVAAACGGDDDNGSADDVDDDAGLTCGSLFSEAEIDEIFLGEAYQLLDSFDDSIGLLTCSWETTDEAEDDFAFIVMTAQVFTGDPVPAESFYDPTLFDDTVPVDDVGADAFYSEAGGFYFLDDDIGGALALTEVDVSSPDDISRPIAEVEALFRTFAERTSELT